MLTIKQSFRYETNLPFLNVKYKFIPFNTTIYTDDNYNHLKQLHFISTHFEHFIECNESK